MEKTLIDEKAQQIKEEANKLYNDLRLSLLRQGEAIYLTVLGGSMYPFVKSGDKIKIEPINGRKIRIGDIAAVDMKTDERLRFFVHRIVKITTHNEKKIYFTKGDAHNGKGLDGPIAIDSIAGKVRQIERKGLNIDLETPLWRYLNNCIGRLSLRYPKIIPFFSRCINMILERKSFLAKVKNRLKKGNPILYNAEELLLICARKDLNEELKNKAIDLIKEGVHWERFTESAMRGGVTVFIYYALRQIAPYARIPQFVLDRLRSGYSFIVPKGTCQHKELMEILKLFTKEGIPVLPLKGTLLSKRLYGDIAARSLQVDIDLLIKEKDKEKVAALLEGIGYSFNPGSEVRSRQWQYNFFKPKAVIIDLHWDITMMGRSYERIEGLWRGVRLVEEDGIGYYEFKEEELLLYLSAHLVNSGCFGQLRYVCDINELLNRYKDALDWGSIIKKAKSWRLSSSLYTALKLSKDVFNSGVPLRGIKKLKPNILTLILIKIFANKKVILRNGIRRRFINGFLSYIFFELIEARSLKDYLAIFKRVFFPPKEAIGNRSYILRIFKGSLKLFQNYSKILLIKSYYLI